MAVESFVSGVLTNANKPGRYIFDLVTMLSSGVNYEVIDSYSSASTPTRYKGNPVADAIWTSYSSVGALNSWVIIQPTNPTYSPAWQLKLQNVDYSAGVFDDPSGHDYGYEGDTSYSLYWRFSPYGGWSLADTGPDFDDGVDPSVSVSQNYQTRPQTNYDTGEFGIFMTTCDQDTLVLFTRSYNIYYNPLQLIGYFGDYVPKGITQTAKHRCGLAPVNWAAWLEFSDKRGNEIIASEASPDSPGSGNYMWHIHPDDIGRRELYTTIPCENLCGEYRSPEKYSPPSVLLYPIYFRGPYLYPNIAGKLRLMAKTNGIGKFRIFGGSEWLSLWPEYSVCVKWDGTVNPWPIS